MNPLYQSILNRKISCAAINLTVASKCRMAEKIAKIARLFKKTFGHATKDNKLQQPET